MANTQLDLAHKETDQTFRVYESLVTKVCKMVLPKTLGRGERKVEKFCTTTNHMARSRK